MKNKMGYILIVAGFILLVWGLVIVLKPQKVTIPNSNYMQPIKGETNSTENNGLQPIVDNFATFEENKAKGDAFEKFIVKKFNRKYFTLQEWRSDKYVDGIYAVSNHFPDLEIIFEHKHVKETFAVECKWRKSFYNNEIEWAENYQVKNYKEYAERLNIPVFVLIGIGGKPEKPHELFIVPLERMHSNIISKEELSDYRKEDDYKDFFWDFEKNELR